MKIKILIILIMALLCTITLNAQTSFNENDSIVLPKENSKLAFGVEPSGKVCINGLEKLEVAVATDKSLLFVNQLHFFAPGPLEGRLFMQAEQERQKSASSNHFFEATVDVTVKEFPLHIGYTMGLDQLGRKPNITYSGPTLTNYWSDMKKVHKVFHIARTSVSWLSLTEHLQTQNFEDSSVHLGRHMEYSVFYQLQPLHLTTNLSIFHEGLLRVRQNISFAEIELGLRHKKILEELVGLGLRLDFENFHFHAVSGVIRFNISNPNPKHSKN